MKQQVGFKPGTFWSAVECFNHLVLTVKLENQTFLALGDFFCKSVILIGVGLLKYVLVLSSRSLSVELLGKCVYVFEWVSLDQNAHNVLVCVLSMMYGMCVLAGTTSLQC